MSVWLTIPSKRPAPEANRALALWRKQGYKIALWLDYEPRTDDPLISDLVLWSPGAYRGYANAVNALIRQVMVMHARAEWFIAAGDDVEPDMNYTANEIAAECQQHFSGTYGVMQPTGDRWGENEPWAKARFPHAPAYIDRICGSAWIGREFVSRAYDGKGPLWHEYFHMFVDEELQNVAAARCVLWQRRDLIHLHRHWGRKEGSTAADCPQFLLNVNSSQHWKTSRELFDRRKAAGFPAKEV
jgi:hypothetical protein